MKTRASQILAVLIVMSVVLPGCLPGGGQVPADDSSADTIATLVAATLAAAEAPPDTAAQPPSPTWTIQPAVTASPPEPNFSYAGVSFYFNDLLADNISAGIAPGQYDENSAMWSMPDHREYKFNGWVLSDAFLEASIRIYPVAEFKALNENVSSGLETLDAVLKLDPLNGDELRVPDLFNAGQLYHSNAKPLRFLNGYGARWLSQYGQAYSPIGWPDLFYTFQGFTDDGKYYVSIIFPVTHPSLPNPENVTMDDAFYENFQAYADTTRQALEAEADNSFMPSLVLLDQLVSSLMIGDQ